MGTDRTNEAHRQVDLAQDQGEELSEAEQDENAAWTNR